MDKLKGVAKGGWHPSGDRSIHKDTWKSDLKGIATGKKTDPYEAARSHQSAPLSTLRDPDSFGPPPKHTAYYGDAGAQSQSSPTATSPSAAGWGAARQTTTSRKPEISDQVAKPSLPYRTDTTGLRTDNLPKPPARSTASAASSVVPASSPNLPPRQSTAQAPNIKPPPILPPRQTESATRQSAPGAPPSYSVATQALLNSPPLINPDAVSRLNKAGVAVPGLGIGASNQGSVTQAPVNAAQLGELQQRFARLNNGSAGQILPAATSQTIIAAAQKKAPPPPPKKAVLSALVDGNVASSSNPPPIPLSSKPRP